ESFQMRRRSVASAHTGLAFSSRFLTAHAVTVTGTPQGLSRGPLLTVTRCAVGTGTTCGATAAALIAHLPLLPICYPSAVLPHPTPLPAGPSLPSGRGLPPPVLTGGGSGYCVASQVAQWWWPRRESNTRHAV